MKKLLSLILCVPLMTTMLAACGNDNKDNNSITDGTTTTTTSKKTSTSSSSSTTTSQSVTSNLASSIKNAQKTYNNSDIKGWLKVDGTNINYGVVKTPSGKGIGYYEALGYDKKYSKNGVLWTNSTANFGTSSSAATASIPVSTSRS